MGKRVVLAAAFWLVLACPCRADDDETEDPGSDIQPPAPVHGGEGHGAKPPPNPPGQPPSYGAWVNGQFHGPDAAPPSAQPFGPGPHGKDKGPSRVVGNIREVLFARTKELPQSADAKSDDANAEGGRKNLDGSVLDKRVDMPAVESDPDQKRQGVGYVRGAKTKMGLKDYEGALADANSAVAADPANPEGYVRRAEANSFLKRYDDAERDAVRATTLDAKYANGWQNLAWVRMKQKRFGEAAGAAAKAIALNSDDATSRAILGGARDMLGDRDSALRELEAAAALDPRFRGQLEAARAGGKIYDPDQDSALASAVAAAGGVKSAWPAAWVGGGLLLAGILSSFAAAVFFRRRKGRPRLRFRGFAAETKASGRLGGKYEVLKVIGRGGMGTVYVATDHILGRPVAIKKVSEELAGAGAREREMLLREARTVASLHHPAIVEIYEIFEEGRDFYLVFELVTGKTAAQILAENGKLGLPRCLDILRPIGAALDFAHGHNLVHRDLKPANIMVSELGQVKLMDFGIARSVADAVATENAPTRTPSAWLARTRTLVGTPAYMAPEADSGLVSKAGDIYALGVCLYELATGRRPFPQEATSAISRLSVRIKPPSSFDPALAAIDALVLSALEPQPARRPLSAGAFIAALDAAARPVGRPA